MSFVRLWAKASIPVTLLSVYKGKIMKNYHNIEKSAFRRGEYVGYGGGFVWHISKSNSSFGNWYAHERDNVSRKIYAFGLQSMSDKLAALSV